jgi:hypothetical protein
VAAVRTVGVIATLAALALVLAAPAGASRYVRFGVQDDAWLASGPGTLSQRLDRLERLGVEIVRFNLRWDQVATKRPAFGRDPDDPAYRWDVPDAVLEGLRRRGLPAVVTLLGTPAWANGGRAWNVPPKTGSTFANFTAAAAARYPWVRHWLIWNEPNLRRFLSPPSPAVYTRRLLNPAYRVLHQAIPRVRVGGGVTAPRANGGVSPVDWIRRLGAAGARLDAYAHHPYPGNPVETPSSGGCDNRRCKTITMSNIELLLAEVKRAFGPKRIWLTEYGYQTISQERLLGVSQARQSRFLAEAARRVRDLPAVDMLIHFLVQDDVVPEGWQSGFYTHTGKAKLSARGFPLPLLQVARRGASTTLWGQVRPRAGRQPYRIQILQRGRWVSIGGARRTDARGFFTLTVRAARGARVRLWSTRDRLASPTLRLH